MRYLWILVGIAAVASLSYYGTHTEKQFLGLELKDGRLSITWRSKTYFFDSDTFLGGHLGDDEISKDAYGCRDGAIVLQKTIRAAVEPGHYVPEKIEWKE